MKKIALWILAAVCCLALCTALGESATNTVTIGDWLEQEGDCGDCLMTVTIREVLNPVLAVAEDETGSVNLFGLNCGGCFFGFGEGMFQEGDTIVIANPVYNVFEGTVEMADSRLVEVVLDEEAGSYISIRDWRDAKGAENVYVEAMVSEVINPVLASIIDETGSVNLFGVQADGEFCPLDQAGIQACDLLILQNPVYNEYEGTIEMAESVLLRKISPIPEQ